MKKKVEKMIKDYIKKQVDKELNKRIKIQESAEAIYNPYTNYIRTYDVKKFTINWKPVEPELLKIGMKDLEPKDDTITFMLKKEINGVPEYLTLRGTKFTSYNKAKLLDSEPDYITTSVSIDPKKCGWNTRKRKTKPRFTTAQRKSMR